MNRIYITGFMGTGKSFIGKRLAGVLNVPFFDVDSLFEEKYHFTIMDFFERFGETEFRKLEKKLLERTVLLERGVIATGGGTPCHHGNMDLISKNGISVYLKMDPKQIVQRLLQSKRPRPMIRNLQGEALHRRVLELLTEREVFYSQATITIDITGLPVNGIVSALLEKLDAAGYPEFLSR